MDEPVSDPRREASRELVSTTPETLEQERLRLLLNFAPCAAMIVESKPGGRVFGVNERFERLLGYGALDLSTSTDFMLKIVDGDQERARVQAVWGGRRESSDWLEEAIWLRTKDGHRLLASIREVHLWDSLACLYLSDETRRYQAECAIQALEERYRRLIESSPDGVVAHDGGRIVFVNAAGARIVGASAPEELVGMELFRFVHPDSRKIVARRIAQILGGKGAGKLIRERFLRLDGATVEVEVAAAEVELAGRKVSQVVFRDVTERVRAEEERRQLEIRIQHTRRLESLALLAGGVAHDFNNLLMGIQGNLELAQMTLPPGNKAEPRIAVALRASQRAAELATRMLAYAGRARLEVKVSNLRRLLHDMADILTAPLGSPHVVELLVSEHLPAVEVDATQMRQVILNLVTNAFEAMGEHPGIVRVSARALDKPPHPSHEAWTGETLPDGPCVALEVADTGPGMDETTRNRVFEPFFSTKDAGRGLGLAAVLGIVRGHRGLIQLESEPGQGTIFRILLPACATRESTELPATDTHPASSGTCAGTILLVDDQELVREVTTNLLEAAGLTVIQASDGSLALELFRTHGGRIDCVLLDRTMPGLSGDDVFLEMHRLNASIPVIISSGFDPGELEERFGELKPAGFLHKPFRFAELVQVLCRVMGRSAGETGLMA